MRRRVFLGQLLGGTLACRQAAESPQGPAATSPHESDHAPAPTPAGLPASAPAAPEAVPDPVSCALPDTALDALVDAVLPAGHGLPGALEAGVRLGSPGSQFPPALAGAQRLLLSGAERLQSLSPQALRTLPGPERLALLEAAQAQDPTFAWAVFRDALVDFTLEAWAGRPGGVWTALRLPS